MFVKFTIGRQQHLEDSVDSVQSRSSVSASSPTGYDVYSETPPAPYGEGGDKFSYGLIPPKWIQKERLELNRAHLFACLPWYAILVGWKSKQVYISRQMTESVEVHDDQMHVASINTPDVFGTVVWYHALLIIAFENKGRVGNK